MSNISKSKSAFIAAHVLKFGLPFGLIFALARLSYSCFFAVQGLTLDDVGISIAWIFLSIIWGSVLGAIRYQKLK